MRRFLIPPSAWGRAPILLPETEAHHAAHVMRLSAGDEVQLFDGQGAQAPGRVVEVGAHGVVVELLSPPEVSPLPPLPVVLGQGLPKAGKLEEILERATELGVGALLPVLTERCVVKPQPGRIDGQVERWRKVAVAAAKQCRRADLPQVEPPCGLAGFLERFQRHPGALGLVAWEQETTPLREVLPPGPPEQVWLLVGPEGGLTPAEVRAAREAGMVAVGLGPRILRTETAGPALLAILQNRWGDVG